MLVQQLINDTKEEMLVESDTCLQQVLDSNAMTYIGCVFILSSSKLVGILTDGDVRRHIVDNGLVGSVGNIMTPNPISVKEDELVPDAFQLMTKNKINQLPVVDVLGNLSGYIEYHALASAMSPEQLFINLDEKYLTENENRHLARYHFAANFILPEQRVLDCACGSGYGSMILAKNGFEVTGVDLNQDAINHAEEKYPKINFLHKDINQLDFADGSFDAVVTLETLEHIPKEICRKFICNITKFLKPGGVFIASSPMLRFKDGLPYITNPYHINELPRDELIDMFETLMPNFKLHFYHQIETRFVPLSEENTGFCIIVGRKLQFE